MYESISKNNELENEMTLDMSYFWYSDAAWCRGFEFKSGCEQRVNPIWIHDGSNIIHENGNWQEPKHIVSPDMWGYSYYVVNHDFKVVWTFLHKIGSYWTIVELSQTITIFGLNDTLLEWRI